MNAFSAVPAAGSCFFSYISGSHLYSSDTLEMYGLHGCAVWGQKQTLFNEREKEDCEHRKSSEVHSEQTGNASSQKCVISS